jgi:hypothetical protein
MKSIISCLKFIRILPKNYSYSQIFKYNKIGLLLFHISYRVLLKNFIEIFFLKINNSL